jgi:arginyl-tRNA synthetase
MHEANTRSPHAVRLFRESIEESLKEATFDIAGRAVAFSPTLKLSEKPDFGDYFTTAPIRLAPIVGRSPLDMAEELAASMAQCCVVARAQATGEGFVNMFVRPHAAAVALAALDTWCGSHVSRLGLSDADHMAYSSACSDHKLRFSYRVWQHLHEVLESEPLDCRSSEFLELLREPEEFSVLLFLHEFPHQFEHGVSTGYIYRLARLISDGLFWNSRLPEFWIHDWEDPRLHKPRRFLVSVCERVLAASLAALRRNGTTGGRR